MWKDNNGNVCEPTYNVGERLGKEKLMNKKKQYEIKNVGIDFTSLRDDYGTITGKCFIYGEENGVETLDTRLFCYGPDEDIQFATPLDDAFTNEEYEEIARILAQNIKDNFELFLAAIKPLTDKDAA